MWPAAHVTNASGSSGTCNILSLFSLVAFQIRVWRKSQQGASSASQTVTKPPTGASSLWGPQLVFFLYPSGHSGSCNCGRFWPLQARV
eukprot:9309843-Pyramimonas_sp.AAC.1